MMTQSKIATGSEIGSTLHSSSVTRYQFATYSQLTQRSMSVTGSLRTWGFEWRLKTAT